MNNAGISNANWTDPEGRSAASAETRRGVPQQRHTWPTPPRGVALPHGVEMRCTGSAGNEDLGCGCALQGMLRWAQNPRSQEWHVVTWPHGGSGRNVCLGKFRPCRRVRGRWVLVPSSEVKTVSNTTATGAGDRQGWI